MSCRSLEYNDWTNRRHWFQFLWEENNYYSCLHPCLRRNDVASVVTGPWLKFQV